MQKHWLALQSTFATAPKGEKFAAWKYFDRLLYLAADFLHSANGPLAWWKHLDTFERSLDVFNSRLDSIQSSEDPSKTQLSQFIHYCCPKTQQMPRDCGFEASELPSWWYLFRK